MLNIVKALGVGHFAGCVAAIGIIVFVGVKWAREFAASRRKRGQDPAMVALYNPKPFRRPR